MMLDAPAVHLPRRLGPKRPVPPFMVDHDSEYGRYVLFAVPMWLGTEFAKDVSQFRRPSSIETAAITTWDNGAVAYRATTFPGTTTGARIRFSDVASTDPLRLVDTDAAILFEASYSSAGPNFGRAIDFTTAGGGVDGGALWIASDSNMVWQPGGGASRTGSGVVTVDADTLGPMSVSWSAEANRTEFKFHDGQAFTVAPESPPAATTDLSIGNWCHADGREYAGRMTWCVVMNRFVPFDEVEFLANGKIYEIFQPVGQRAYSFFFEQLAGPTVLNVQPLDHGHALDAPTLAQDHVLAPQDVSHGHALDNVVLSGNAVLAVADLTHGHTLDEVTLSGTGVLVVQSLEHAHTLDAVAISQDHALVIQSLDHSHTLDEVTVTTDSDSLTVQALLHAHALDNPTLTQAHVLLVDDMLHNHILDNVNMGDIVEVDGERVLLIEKPDRTLLILAKRRAVLQ